MSDNQKRKQSSPETPPLPKRIQMDNIPDEIGKLAADQFLGLIKSLFTELIDEKLTSLSTKEEVETLRQRCSNLETQVIELQESHKNMLKKIDSFQNATNKRILIIKGITTESENLIDTVQNIFRNILEINIYIKHAYFIGKNNERVAVEVLSNKAAFTILKVSKKLKGTAFSISRNYSYESQIKRQYLFDIKNKIKEINPEMKTLVRDDELCAQNKNFRWCNEKRLITENNDNGVAELYNLLKSDMNSMDGEEHLATFIDSLSHGSMKNNGSNSK